MRVVETIVYEIEELSKEAFDKAYNHWLSNIHEYHWGDEVMDTANKIVGLFPGARLEYFNFESTSKGRPKGYTIKWDDECVADLYGPRAYAWVMNNIYPVITRPKKYSKALDNGATLTVLSSVFNEEYDCPLTGVCFDEDALGPIREFINSYHEYPQIRALLYRCVHDLIQSADEDCDSSMSEGAFKTESKANNWEYHENGSLFNNT